MTALVRRTGESDTDYAARQQREADKATARKSGNDWATWIGEKFNGLVDGVKGLFGGGEGGEDGESLWDRIKKLLGGIGGDWKTIAGGIGGAILGFLGGKMFGGGFVGTLIGIGLGIGGFFMGRDFMKNTFGGPDAPERTADGRTRSGPEVAVDVALQAQLTTLSHKVEAIHRIAKDNQLPDAVAAKLRELDGHLQTTTKTMGDRIERGSLTATEKSNMGRASDSMTAKIDEILQNYPAIKDLYTPQLAAIEAQARTASTGGTAGDRTVRRDADVPLIPTSTPAQQLQAEIDEVAQKTAIAQQVLALQVQTGQQTQRQATRTMREITRAQGMVQQMQQISIGQLGAGQIQTIDREFQRSENVLDRVIASDPITAARIQQSGAPVFAGGRPTTAVGAMIDPTQVRLDPPLAPTSQFVPQPTGNINYDALAGFGTAPGVTRQ